jgi:hypothetical protein
MDRVATSNEANAFLTTMLSLQTQATKAARTATDSIPFRNRMYHSEYCRTYQRERSGMSWAIVETI